MNIETFLNKVNGNMLHVMERSGEIIPGLYKDARLNSGKRLRAKVLFAFSQGHASERSVKIATAIEILHAGTLIHDDILDDSRLRRGRPTLYTKHGIANSLLYGDYLFSTAFSLIAQLDDICIYKQMTGALEKVLSGEIMENFKCHDIRLTKKEYLSVIEKKSGVLFGLACKLGAMTAEMSEDMAERSYRFGLNIGMAYQIMDDHFDYFGEDDDKEKFKDLKEGLVTVPLIYLLQRCSKKEKSKVISFLGNKDHETANMEDLVSLMRQYDVPDLISSDVELFIKKAGTLLPEGILQDSKLRFDILSWIREKIGHVPEDIIIAGQGARE